MRKIFVFVSVLLITCQIINAQFKHPGMLHTAQDLALVKSRVQSGKEPWKTAYKEIFESKYGSLNQKARPFSNVNCGPYNKPNIGGIEFYQDGNFAYTMALLWVITEEQKYAEKAIEILNAWSYKLDSVTNVAKELKIGVAGTRYLNAAEIIKHTYKGWKKADQKQFEKMILDIWYETIKNFKPTINGNWDAAAEQTMLCIGIFLDRKDIFDRAYHMLTEGDTNGALDNYFSETGECQESGRDQGHTQMGLSYLAVACEIAWNQGYDAYSLYDNRLAKGFEYTAKFMLGEEVPYTQYKTWYGKYIYGDEISQTGRGQLNPIYELPYHHYHNRKGLEMPYTRRLLEVVRNEAPQDGYMPWASLIYATEPVKITPVNVPNLNMSQWKSSENLPDNYTASKEINEIESFSKAKETYKGMNALQMTWSGPIAKANYFSSPYFDLEPGNYELIFYVKGSGFIRSTSLCTSDVPDKARAVRGRGEIEGTMYAYAPMEFIIKAREFPEWTRYRSTFIVLKKGKYNINISHNNVEDNIANPLLISNMQFNKKEIIWK